MLILFLNFRSLCRCLLCHCKGQQRFHRAEKPYHPNTPSSSVRSRRLSSSSRRIIRPHSPCVTASIVARPKTFKPSISSSATKDPESGSSRAPIQPVAVEGSKTWLRHRPSYHSWSRTRLHARSPFIKTVGSN